MDLQLPETWDALTPEAATRLEAELHREIPPNHPVAGKNLRAVAKRGRRDDVLFALIDQPDGHVYVIHLTWAKETDPKWPWTEPYQNMEDFRKRWPREELD